MEEMVSIKEYNKVSSHFLKELDRATELQDRIDKVKEYIEDNIFCIHDEEILKDLLAILEGGNNE